MKNYWIRLGLFISEKKTTWWGYSPHLWTCKWCGKSSSVHGIFQHKNWGDAKLSSNSSTRETAPHTVHGWAVESCSTPKTAKSIMIYRSGWTQKRNSLSAVTHTNVLWLRKSQDCKWLGVRKALEWSITRYSTYYTLIPFHGHLFWQLSKTVSWPERAQVLT